MVAQKEKEHASVDVNGPNRRKPFDGSLTKLYLVLCLSYALWGIIPLWLSRIPAPPLVVATVRFMSAPIFLIAPILIVWLLSRRHDVAVKEYLKERTLSRLFRRPGTGPPRVVVLIINSIIFALAIDFYIMGLTTLPVWAAAALSYTYPLFDALGEKLVERISNQKEEKNWSTVLTLSSLAVVGAALVSIKELDGQKIVFYNILFPLAFAMLWALFTIINGLDKSEYLNQTPILGKVKLSLVKVAALLGIAGLFNIVLSTLFVSSLLPIIFGFYGYIASGSTGFWTYDSVINMVGLIAVSTAVPYTLYNWALQEEFSRGTERKAIKTTYALVLQSVETITAVVIGMLISGNMPQTHQILGLGLILVTDTALFDILQKEK